MVKNCHVFCLAFGTEAQLKQLTEAFKQRKKDRELEGKSDIEHLRYLQPMEFVINADEKEEFLEWLQEVAWPHKHPDWNMLSTGIINNFTGYQIQDGLDYKGHEATPLPIELVGIKIKDLG